MTSVEYSTYTKLRDLYGRKLTTEQRKLLIWIIENGFIAPFSTLDRKAREYRAKKALETIED